MSTWYYGVGKERHGPISEDQVGRLLSQGAMGPATPVWRDGMTNWMRLDATDLAQKLPKPPPLESGTKKQAEDKAREAGFCRNCGKEVPSSAAACLHCGVPPREGKSFCHHCGVSTSPEQVICVKCGVGFSARQPVSMKKKDVAALLAIVLGPLGVHKFYMGYGREGAIMFFVSIIGLEFTGLLAASIMYFIAITEAFKYIRMSETEFEATYIDGKKAWF